MIKTCPKCHYQRKPSDHTVHEGTCPNCGIAYAKWLAIQQKLAAEKSQGTESEDKKSDCDIRSDDTGHSWKQRLLAELLYVPEQVDALTFGGRALAFVLFSLWGFSFILGGLHWTSIGDSFMHNVNLPFHEFGHVLFSPFGRFMTILGGSLFQVIMPLGLLAAFIIQRHDTFGASIMLWWTGQNLIDVSPYIADAPYRAIPLIRGLGEDAHDWGNLLTMTHSIDKAVTLANTSFALGSVLIVVSTIWSGYLLFRQWARIR